MTSRAAGIDYAVVARPEGVPSAFAASAEASLDFLAIDAIDGVRVDAALWQPRHKPPAETTLVIQVHGSGSNYVKPPNDVLGAGLAAGGRAVLAINTRQHDDKVATENFFDIRRDIDAAVHTARALGFRRLVLQGHSLGSVQVLFYAAINWDSDIKAISLLGMFGNLPWKTRNILIANDDHFVALAAAAVSSLRAGRPTALLPLTMGWFTSDKMPVTAQHFLTYRWEETSAADSTYWISRVTLPILMVRNEADGIIQPFEPHMLMSAARAPASLVESIRYIMLPDKRPRSLEGHSFIGNEVALVKTVTGWLDEQNL